MTELNSNCKPIMLWILDFTSSMMLLLTLLNTPFNFGYHFESLRFFVRFRLFHNFARHSTAPLGSTRLLVSDHSLLLRGQVFQRCNQPRSEKTAHKLRGTEICQDMPSIPVIKMTLRFKIAAFHHCRWCSQRELHTAWQVGLGIGCHCLKKFRLHRSK